MGVSGNQRRDIVFSASNVYNQYTATAGAGSTAYVELTASTSSAIYITHVVRTPSYNNGGNNGNVIIATGAAASEVVIFTGYSISSYSSTQTSATVYPLPFPIRVPSGTRLSAKISASDVAGPVLSVVYVNESAVA